MQQVPGSLSLRPVYISHIDYTAIPLRVFAQFDRAFASRLELSLLDLDLNNNPASETIDPSLLRSGQHLFGLYKSDQKWYRCTVEQMRGEQQILVRFIDYGNSQICNATDLRLLHDRQSQDLLAVPPLAEECVLAGIVPKGAANWSNDVQNIMSRDVLYKEWLCQVHFKHGRVSVVDLCKHPGVSSLTKSLVDHGWALRMPDQLLKNLVPPLRGVELLPCKYYPVVLSHCEGPLSFYVQLTSHQKGLEQVNKHLTAYLNTVHLGPQENLHLFYAQPVIGTMCCVRSSTAGGNQVVRCQITHVQDNKTCQILCVDYGFVELHQVGALFVLPDDCPELPRVAIPCALKDYQELTVQSAVSSNDGGRTIAQMFVNCASARVLDAEVHYKNPTDTADTYVVALYDKGCLILKTLIENLMAVGAISRPQTGGMQQPALMSHQIATTLRTSAGQPLLPPLATSSALATTPGAAPPGLMLPQRPATRVTSVSRPVVSPFNQLMSPASGIDASMMLGGCLSQPLRMPATAIQPMVASVLPIQQQQQQMQQQQVQHSSQVGSASAVMGNAGVAVAGAQEESHQATFKKMQLRRKQREAVRVSHVEDPEQFFVQLLSHEHLMQSMITELNELYEEADFNRKAITKKFYPGQPIMVRQPVENVGMWLRAVVEKESTAQLQVQLVDFGIRTTALKDDCRAMLKDYVMREVFAIECNLFSIKHRGQWQQNDVTYLKELVDNKQLQMIVVTVEEEVCSVDLFDIQANGDRVYINEMFGRHTHSLSSVPDAIVAPVVMPTGAPILAARPRYNRLELQSDHEELGLVVYQTDPSDFYVQLHRYTGELMRMQVQIASRYSDMGPNEMNLDRYDPGTPCCACYEKDNLWYRAEVIELRPDKGTCKVHFVDYGNDELVSTKSVKLLFDQYLTQMPALGIHCALHMLQPMRKGPWPLQATNFMESLAENGTQLMVQLHSKDTENRWQVTLHQTKDGVKANENINAMFVQRNWAERVPDPHRGGSAYGGQQHALLQFQPVTSFPPITRLQPNLREAVSVVHVESVEDFYVHLLGDPQSARILDELQAHLQSIYGTSQRAPLVPAVRSGQLSMGSMYVAPFTDGNWYRCMVQNITTDGAMVFYVDFGNTHKVPLDQIFPLLDDPRIVQAPAFAVHCRLRGVSGGVASEELVTKMYEDLESCQCCFVEKVDQTNVWLVDLYQHGEPPMLYARKLLDNKLCKPANAGSSLGVREDGTDVEIPGLPVLHVPARKDDFLDVVVSYVAAPSEVYVQLKNHSNILMELAAKLEKVYGGASGIDVVINPQRGQLIAAKYEVDDNWYRAVFLCRTSPTRYSVYFVDFGNTEEVGKNDAKGLTSEFLQIPPQALKCCLDRHHQMNRPEHRTRAISLLEGKDACLHIVGKEEEKFVVIVYQTVGNKDYDLNKALLNQGEVPPTIPAQTQAQQHAPQPQQSRSAFGTQQQTDGFGPRDDDRFGRRGENEGGYRGGGGFRGSDRGRGGFGGDRGRGSGGFGGERGSGFGSRGGGFGGDRGRGGRASRSDDGDAVSGGGDERLGGFGGRGGGFGGRGGRGGSERGGRGFGDRGRTGRGGFGGRGGSRGSGNFGGRANDRDCGPERDDDNENDTSSYGFGGRGSSSIVDSKTGFGSSGTPVTKPEPKIEPMPVQINAATEEPCHVQYALSPSKFWVQPSRFDDDAQSVINKLGSFNAKDKLPNAAVGQFCVSKYHDVWYRSVITAVQNAEKTCTVQYVDFGNSETVSLDELYVLPADLTKPHMLVVEAALLDAGTEDADWAEASKQAFDRLAIDSDMCTVKFVHKLKRAGAPLLVVLSDGESVSVGHRLCESRLAIPKTLHQWLQDENQEDVVRMLSVRNKASIAKKQHVPAKLSCCQSLDNMYLLLQSETQALETMLSKLKADFENLPVLRSPSVNDVVCVQTPSKDHGVQRVRLCELRNGKALALCVDSGEVCVVPQRKLRALIRTYAEPAYAIEATLDACPNTLTGFLTPKVRDIDVTAASFIGESGDKQIVRLFAGDGRLDVLDMLGLTKVQPLPHYLLPLIPKKSESHTGYMSGVCESPSLFWVHLTEEQVLTDFQDKLQQYYAKKQSKVNASDVLVGLACAALFEEQFYRAVVERVEDDTVIVRFVDYGNSEEKPTSELLVLSEQFLSQPPYAIRCTLPQLAPKDGVNEEWSEEDICGFKALLEGKKLTMEFAGTSYEPCVLSALKDEEGIDLIAKAVEDNLALKVEWREYATKYASEDEVCARSMLVVCLKEEHDEAKTPRFYAYDAHMQATQDAILDDLDNAYGVEPCEPLSAEACVEGTPCVVKFPVGDIERFHRCKVINASEMKVTVSFVDYGNVQTVELAQVFPLKACYGELPPLATLYDLETPESLTGQQRTMLDEAIVVLEEEYKYMITSVEAQPRRVALFAMKGISLVDALTAQPLAKPTYTQLDSADELIEATQYGRQTSYAATTIAVRVIMPMVNGATLSPAEFLLHREADVDALDLLTQRLTHTFKKIPRLKTIVHKGQPCLALNRLNGCAYRARIVESKNDGQVLLVEFVDYGQLAEMPRNDVRMLSEEDALTAPMVIKAQLKGIDTRLASALADRFTELVRDKQFMGTFDAVVMDDVYQVQLKSGDEDFLHALGASPTQELPCFTQPSLPTALTVDAYVSVVENPFHFYIQLLRDEQAIEEMNEKMQRACQKLVPVHVERIEVGLACVVKYANDGSGNPYRARVETVSDEDVSVRFIDFGDTQEGVSKGEVYELPSDVKDLPPLAVRCTLANVQSSEDAVEKWSEDSVACLNEHAPPDVVFSVTFLTKLQPCAVTLSADGRDLGEELIGAGKAVQKETSTQQAIAYPPYALRKRANVAIGFVETTARFYSTFTTDLAMQTAMQEQLQLAYVEPGESIPANKLMQGLPCVTKYKDVDGTEAYYRAKISEVVNEEMVRVQFVDFGNSQDTSATEIYALKASFAGVPPLVFECTLQGYGDHLSEEQQLRLKAELNTERYYRMEIENFVEDVNELKFPLVVRMWYESTFDLVEKSLLEPRPVDGAPVLKTFVGNGDAAEDEVQEGDTVSMDMQPVPIASEETKFDTIMTNGNSDDGDTATAFDYHLMRAMEDEMIDMTPLKHVKIPMPEFEVDRLLEKIRVQGVDRTTLEITCVLPLHDSPNSETTYCDSALEARYAKDDPYLRLTTDEVVEDNCCVVDAPCGMRRACIKELLDNGNVIVELVDHGDDVEVERTAMYRLFDDVSTYPTRTFKCFLSNLQPCDGAVQWDDATGGRLEELSIDLDMEVMIIRKNETSYDVRLQQQFGQRLDLASELVSKKYAEWKNNLFSDAADE